MNLLQLKITLLDYSPEISRTILILETTSFLKLHKHIQEMFGFQDYHMWSFENNKELGIVCEEESDEYESLFEEMFTAKKINIWKIFMDRNIKKLMYNYDFGDNWTFSVDLEKIIEWKKWDLPKVISVKWGILMDDCGWSYWLKKMIDAYKKEDKEFSNDIGYEGRWEFCSTMLYLTQSISLDNFSINWKLKLKNIKRQFWVKDD